MVETKSISGDILKTLDEPLELGLVVLGRKGKNEWNYQKGKECKGFLNRNVFLDKQYKDCIRRKSGGRVGIAHKVKMYGNN